MYCINKKSRTRETPTLWAGADSTTNTVKSCFFVTFVHFWVLLSHLFAFLPLFETFFCTFCQTKLKQLCVTCHKSHVKCHISHVTYHLPPVTNANSHRQFLLTTPSSTVDWFKIKKNLNQSRTKNVLKIVVSFEPTQQLKFMKKDKNLILQPLLTMTPFVTDKNTHKKTWRLYDQPGPMG